MVKKMGHSLIVTVVPVARLKFKLFLGGTVKPLSVILVHLTALATSVVNVSENHAVLSTSTTALTYLTKN